MHQALALHEIVLSIVHELHVLQPRQVPSFALTCKAFCDPALDVIWANLPSLIPLINLLPNDLVGQSRFDNTLHLLRYITLNDLNRFLLYTKRVRTVEWLEVSDSWASINRKSTPYVDPALLTQLANKVPSSPILPGLRKLKWAAHSIEGLATITRYMSPSLTAVEVSPFEGVQNVLHSKLLSVLAKLPRLQRLFLSGAFPPGDNGSDIQEQINALFHPQSQIQVMMLDVQPTPPQLLGAIQEAPNLRALVLNLGHWLPPTSTHYSQPIQGFRSLEKLALCSTISAANNVLSRLASPRIHTINIGLTAVHPEDITLAFPSTAMWRNLASVTVSGGMVPRSDLKCRAADLDPLISNCPNLQKLDLCFYVMDLNDQTVSSMAKAWPKLIVLHLEAAPAEMTLETHHPQVTLAGLHALLESCPDLLRLSLCIDATKAPWPLLAGKYLRDGREVVIAQEADLHTLSDADLEITDGDDGPNPIKSCRLRFGNSVISHPRIVERSLSRLTKRYGVNFWLEKEYQPLSGWLDESDEQRRRRESLWEEVYAAIVQCY